MEVNKAVSIVRIANICITLTWLYHGIVPKIMFMETGELPMVTSFGMFTGYERVAVYAVGIGEILFGLSFLFFGRVRMLHYLSIAALLILAVTAFTIDPRIYTAPFNPASTSIGVIGMSLIVLRAMRQ